MTKPGARTSQIATIKSMSSVTASILGPHRCFEGAPGVFLLILLQIGRVQVSQELGELLWPRYSNASVMIMQDKDTRIEADRTVQNARIQDIYRVQVPFIL